MAEEMRSVGLLTGALLRHFSQAQSVAEILSLALRAACTSVGSGQGMAVLPAENGRILQVAALYGPPEMNWPVEVGERLNAGIFPLSAHTLTPYTLPLPDTFRPATSTLTIPWTDVEATPAGYLLLFEPETSDLAGELPDHLTTLAQAAFLALRNLQLRQESEAKAAQLDNYTQQAARHSSLAEIELAINQPHELDTLLNRIVQLVTHLLPASGGSSITLWDRKQDLFVVSASSVPGQPTGTTANRVRRKGGATRWIVEQGEPIIVVDTRTDPFGANPMLAEYGLQAYAGFPLLVEHEVVGVLYALDNHVRHYTEDDLDFLSALASRAALAVAKVQLYVQLQSANELLQDRSKALERANQDLKEFAHVVSHDLKAPLRGIIALVKWLHEDHGPQLSQDIRQSLDQIDEQAQRLQRLITGILRYSAYGYEASANEDVDLDVILAEVVFSLAPPADVTISWQSPLPHLWVDAIRMRQLVTNLLSNAIKYRNKAKTIIEFKAEQQGNYWLFAVKDNGQGIDVDYQKLIFKPFKIGHAVSADSSNSTGVGLAICKKIVELYDGEIWVESTAGQGSTFYFTIKQ